MSKDCLQYLKDHQERFLEELMEYLRIPSISAQTERNKDVHACCDWLVDHCQSIGLKTRKVRTDGNPVVMARTPRKGKSKKPHFMVYGHYDVQPPEPLDLWTSPPFEPRIEGDKLFARGATDNKGQHFVHLKAVESYLKTGTELPCDLTFMIEGEEEVGSAALIPALKTLKHELDVAAVVVSDNGMPSLRYPALTYGLRGVAACEVTLTGPNRDLHSGLYGGAVDNPAMVLCQMLAHLRDRRGRVNVPGFYDDVEPLTRLERSQNKRFPLKDTRLAKDLGVRELFGERHYHTVERRSARPTLEINGLTSGYQGEGSKTIIPSTASAKITCRLVPNQKPAVILRLLERELKRHCPRSVKMTFEKGHSGKAYMTAPDGPFVTAALDSLKEAFGRPPILMREGGSIPIVTDFKEVLKVDTLLLGLGLPDDNAHSPDEKMSLTAFRKGMHMSTVLWEKLARAAG
ncbi:MAG: dipeptidase [Verrucomicrobiota bacterium]|jgi:acetylornithine deacetylase/succinyl-diaminopimelate desuccinylase-like protein|nr:dipeptidase [Verrucomicrobiota bacterium]